MSGAQTSSFADPNVLLPTLSGAQTARVVQNQLLNQETAALMPYRVQEAQQTTGAADMEMMARASQGLLSLPDEASRAAAYPGVVASLQQQGYAKNAPSQYPGEARLRQVAAMGLSLKDQYSLGVITPPGLADALQRSNAPLPGQPGYGAPAPQGSGSVDNNFGNIRPVGATTGFNTYATPQDGIAAMSSNLAAYKNQHGITTLNDLTARWAPKGDGANDPVAYAKTLGTKLGIDPNAEINLADPLLQSRLIPAMAAIEKGKPFNQPMDVLTAGIQQGL